MGRKSLDVEEVDRRLVAILQARMDALGISRRQLASLSAVTRGRLDYVMTMQRPLLVNELDDVCNALGLVPWQVMREAECSV